MTQVWVDGLFTGATYALIALGFAIVFQPTRIMNFAQGESFILGAAVGFQVVSLWAWGWAAALVVTVALGIVMGLLMERMIMLPVRLSGSRFAWIIATLAAAIIFQAIFGLVYTDDTLRPGPTLPGDLTVLGAAVSWQRLLVVVVALAIMVAYDRFLRGSVYGRAIRATAHDADTAVLMGVPVKRVIVLSFVISSVITALAGLLAAPVLFVEPASGLLFTVKGFTAAVIGGLGSPRGALVGGLLIGLLDAVVRNLFDATAGNFVVFAALALILVAFPAGLFGRPIEAH